MIKKLTPLVLTVAGMASLPANAQFDWAKYKAATSTSASAPTAAASAAAKTPDPVKRPATHHAQPAAPTVPVAEKKVVAVAVPSVVERKVNLTSLDVAQGAVAASVERWRKAASARQSWGRDLNADFRQRADLDLLRSVSMISSVIQVPAPQPSVIDYGDKSFVLASNFQIPVSLKLTEDEPAKLKAFAKSFADLVKARGEPVRVVITADKQKSIALQAAIRQALKSEGLLEHLYEAGSGDIAYVGWTTQLEQLK